LYYKYVYLLAHPIYLCVAMIVYAVYVSRWCCRWIWSGVAPERGWTGDISSWIYVLWF